MLDNSNYVNLHGSGDFSHAYVIMHQYFDEKNRNAKNEYISFYIQLDIFSCMIISYT
jgi:isopentenyl phosphate kinase